MLLLGARLSGMHCSRWLVSNIFSAGIEANYENCRDLYLFSFQILHFWLLSKIMNLSVKLLSFSIVSDSFHLKNEHSFAFNRCLVFGVFDSQRISWILNMNSLVVKILQKQYCHSEIQENNSQVFLASMLRHTTTPMPLFLYDNCLYAFPVLVLLCQMHAVPV